MNVAPVVRMITLRILTAVGTLVAVSLVIFFGVNSLPGNAASVALGYRAGDPELLRAAEHAAGLDRPAVVRYLDWASGILHGDLGRSLVSQTPVADLISHSIVASAYLAVIAILVMIPVVLFLGVASALVKDRLLDHMTMGWTLTMLSTPEFVVGTVLAAGIASGLGLLPAVSLLDPSVPVLQQAQLLVLPVLTLVLCSMGSVRFIRAATIEVLSSDFVRMAVLRGTSRRTLLLRHVLPNAIAPAIQVLGLTVGAMAGGVVIVESVFSYPGIGVALVQAVGSRDITTVTSIAIIVSGFYVIANLVADVVIICLNPRLRKGSR
jgi:peptide/nickel transport system permease protein